MNVLVVCKADYSSERIITVIKIAMVDVDLSQVLYGFLLYGYFVENVL